MNGSLQIWADVDVVDFQSSWEDQRQSDVICSGTEPRPHFFSQLKGQARWPDWEEIPVLPMILGCPNISALISLFTNTTVAIFFYGIVCCED